MRNKERPPENFIGTIWDPFVTHEDIKYLKSRPKSGKAQGFNWNDVG
jgi:hypothetical protein